MKLNTAIFVITTLLNVAQGQMNGEYYKIMNFTASSYDHDSK